MSTPSLMKLVVWAVAKRLDDAERQIKRVKMRIRFVMPPSLPAPGDEADILGQNSDGLHAGEIATDTLLVPVFRIPEDQ